MIGKKIISPNRIIELAKQGKSVWDRYLKRTQPAAWIQNYPFIALMGQISAGRYYEYKAKKYERKKA